MQSPFPGMDPFLELPLRWPVFHGWFIRELARLPVVGLPLTPDRPNLPFDLEAAFRSAYALSIRRRIDYATEPVPEPPLSPEDQAWVESVRLNISDFR